MSEVARLEGVIALTGLEKAKSGLVGLGATVDKTQAGIDGLGKSSTKAGDEVGGLGERSARAGKGVGDLGRQLQSTGRDMHAVGGKLTRGVTLPLIGLGLAAGKAGMEFDAQMSKVVAKSGATGREIGLLRAQAIKLGSQTSFSAREAAQGMEQLAAAGMKPRQVMQAMPGLLDAAAASGEGVAEVSMIVASSLAQFNLKATDSTRIADVLAKASNETQGSIGSMGEALKYAGTGARMLGYDIEETTGMIAAMVKAGIDGSQAGTSLRMGLQRLAVVPPMKALDKVADISPKLKDIWKSAAPVPDKLKAMSSAFQKLSGTQRTAAAALIFGTEASTGMLQVINGGPAKIDKWTASMRNSTGEAKRMGDQMRNNLRGDIEQLGGALESAFIGVFDKQNGGLRGLAQGLTGAVNGFGQLSAGTQQAALGMGVVAAATGPALMAFGSMAEGAGKLASAFSKGGIAARGMALMLNPYALAIGGAALGAGLIYTKVKLAQRADEEWRQGGIKLIGVIEQRKAAAAGLQSAQARAQSATERASAIEKKYGDESPQFAAAQKAKADATAAVAVQQERLNRAEGAAAKIAGGGDGKGANGGGANPGEEGRQRADLVTTESKLTAELERQSEARARLGVEHQAVTAKIANARAEQDRLTEAMKTAGGQTQENADAWKDQQKIIDDNNRVLAESQAAYDKITKKVNELRREQRQLQESLGVTGVASLDVKKRISEMANTPLNMKIARKLLSEMSAAERAATFGTSNINKILGTVGTAEPSKGWGQAFARDLANARADAARGVTVTIKVNQHRNITTTTNSVFPSGKGPLGAFAEGGIITGPGTDTSDNILAFVSPNEAIVPAKSTRANRRLVEWMIDNPGKQALPGYATGKKPKTTTAAKKKVTTNASRPDGTGARPTISASADVSAAQFAANQSAAALAKKKAAAEAALNATITAQANALREKAGARAEVISSDKTLDGLQRRYDSISGKDASARKRELKPQLDAAKKAAKAAKARYDKLLDTLRSAGDRRRSLASDIVGYDEALAGAAEDAERKAQEDRDKTAADQRDDENLRREALGLESLEEEERRLKKNAIRATVGLPPIPPGGSGSGSGEDADLAAMLAQSQKRAQIAEDTARLGQSELAAFTSSGDIGRGMGANAYQSAAPTVIVQSLTGYSPEIQQVVADAAGGGFAAGANSYRMYTGRG